MNALGSSLFHDAVNQTYKKKTISTMQIIHLRDVLKDSFTRREIKNNMNIHCPVAADSGLGCLR
jgi:hypothetical protein